MLPQLFGPWIVPKVCFRAALTRFSEAVPAWEKIFCVTQRFGEFPLFFIASVRSGPCGIARASSSAADAWASKSCFPAGPSFET